MSDCIALRLLAKHRDFAHWPWFSANKRRKLVRTPVLDSQLGECHHSGHYMCRCWPFRESYAKCEGRHQNLPSVRLDLFPLV